MAKKKIMIVDDEENVRQLIEAVLQEEGYDVVTAADGKECLAKLKKIKPDLILLDMMMPGMSGREVCEKIRTDPKTKNLKIIFVTVARFSELGKTTLSKLKVSDYISKPFDNDDLIKRAKKALGA
jgi:two-component system phosphate regulon response regulator PhoB